MSGEKSVLTVAFDGLDENLIEKYNLENVVQEETGSIDNDTGIKERMTAELFSSFITGDTWETHGVTGLKRWDNKRQGKFIDLINVKGSRRFEQILKAAFDNRKVWYDKEDLQSDALFDKIPRSKALFVPGYNPSWFQRVNPGMRTLKHGGDMSTVMEVWDREHMYRRRELFDRLGDDHRFLMCHIHLVDTAQHMYSPDGEVLDHESLRRYYKKIDRLAGEIKEEADNYDTVLFMSDHGIPDGDQHNKRAFYSVNHGTTLGEEPHITDFHDYILELVG